MASLSRPTPKNKLIFACHGIASEDKLIKVPFEFSSMYFFCDLGFTLVTPLNLDNKPIRPDLLVDSICKNSLIPKRLDSNGRSTVIRIDEEIGNLTYKPDESGEILLNHMRFRLSMRDRHVPLHYLNFGIHYCDMRTGVITRIIDFDRLYSMLKTKATEKGQSVEIAVFTYIDVFRFLREVAEELMLDPTKIDIAMFSCRSFTPSSPVQIPVSILPTTNYVYQGGFKRNPTDEYSNMLFLENGVAMVSEEIFNKYNIMEPYNPEFIPIANNFVKLLVEYNNERRASKTSTERKYDTIYSDSLPIEVAGGSKRSKKYRSKLNKYRKRHHSRTASMKRKRTSKHKKSLSKRRK